MGFFLKKREGESQRREEGGGGRGRERERERERAGINNKRAVGTDVQAYLLNLPTCFKQKERPKITFN